MSRREPTFEERAQAVDERAWQIRAHAADQALIDHAESEGWRLQQLTEEERAAYVYYMTEWVLIAPNGYMYLCDWEATAIAILHQHYVEGDLLIPEPMPPDVYPLMSDWQYKPIDPPSSFLLTPPPDVAMDAITSVFQIPSALFAEPDEGSHQRASEPHVTMGWAAASALWDKASDSIRNYQDAVARYMTAFFSPPLLDMRARTRIWQRTLRRIAEADLGYTPPAWVSRVRDQQSRQFGSGNGRELRDDV